MPYDDFEKNMQFTTLFPNPVLMLQILKVVINEPIKNTPEFWG